MKKSYLLIFLILLFFIGCTKAINDPTALAPKTSYSTWVKADESITMSSKYCTPLLPKNYKNEKLTLAELIDIGLLNNPNTKATWAEARSKAASYGQSLSSYFPEIDFIGTYDKSRKSNILPPAAVTFTNTTTTPELNITYTIFDFGKRKYTSVAAQEALYIADYSHNRELQTVIKTIMDDYYDLESQKQQLLYLEKDLYDANTSLDAAFEKFETGTGSIDDITQAKTNYLQVKVNLIEQKRIVKTAYTTLITDIGLPATMEMEFEGFPQNIQTNYVLDSVNSMIKKAQKNRYDLLAQESNLKENEANLDLAKSQFFPNFNLDFDLGKNYYKHHHSEDYHYTLLLKLTYPLFSGFNSVNEIKKQKANILKSKAQLAQLELEMIKEVTTSHYTVKIASETLHYSKEYLQTAEKRFDISLTKYKEGLETILDLLSAQTFLQDARKTYVNAQKQWYSSICDLAYSTGSLCNCEGKSL